MHCVYNWVAACHRARTKEDVYAAMPKVATNIDEWEAIGYSIRMPRLTWVATCWNSTITIKLDKIKKIDCMMVLVRLFTIWFKFFSSYLMTFWLTSIVFINDLFFFFESQISIFFLFLHVKTYGIQWQSSKLNIFC